MKTLGYWLGAAYELATRCAPRLGWRRYQRLTLVWTHTRDVLALVLAIVLYGMALLLAGA